jgi:phosphatidylserine/phosphatidylglycerophosphate/cardiolipin synthase-like enzyme
VWTGIPPAGARDYLAAVLQLFERATDHVYVVCPFIDKDGADQLRAWAGQSTAKVSIFTREAAPELYALAKAAGWNLYHYRGTPGEDEHRGFHCKFFLADDAVAILGSVNLVYHNMIENLELGMRTNSPRHVAALADIVDAIARASDQVLP